MRIFLLLTILVTSNIASAKEPTRTVADEQCKLISDYLVKSEAYFNQLNSRLYRMASDEVMKPGKEFLAAHRKLIESIKLDQHCN